MELYYCEKLTKIELKGHVPGNLMIMFCTVLSDYPDVNLL